MKKNSPAKWEQALWQSSLLNKSYILTPTLFSKLEKLKYLLTIFKILSNLIKGDDYFAKVVDISDESDLFL